MRVARVRLATAAARAVSPVGATATVHGVVTSFSCDLQEGAVRILHGGTGARDCTAPTSSSNDCCGQTLAFAAGKYDCDPVSAETPRGQRQRPIVVTAGQQVVVTLVNEGAAGDATWGVAAVRPCAPAGMSLSQATSGVFLDPEEFALWQREQVALDGVIYSSSNDSVGLSAAERRILSWITDEEDRQEDARASAVGGDGEMGSAVDEVGAIPMDF